MKKNGRQVHKTGRMSRHQKFVIGLALAFLFYSLLGFLVVPVVLKNTLGKKLSENLNRDVFIKNIQINPYLLQVSVNNFLVQNLSKDDHFVAFDQLFVDLEAVSLFKRALVVKSLVLSGPRINITRNNDLTYNFSDIVANASENNKKSSKPLLLSLNNIEILNGAITFVDEPKDTTHRVHDLNFALPFLSNVEHHVETYVHPNFSAIVNSIPVKLSGKTIPFHNSLSTVFDIKFSNLSIPAYLAYLPEHGNLTLKSGFLDATATLGFIMEPGNKPSVTVNGDFTVRQLTVASSENETYLSVPQLDIELADSKPLEQDFHFSRFVLAEPEFLLRRTNDGDILPFALLPKNTEPQPVKSDSAGKESTLRLIVDEIDVNGGTFRFEDQSNAEQFQTTLTPVDIKVTDLSTVEGAEASYAFSTQTEVQESIVMNGRLSLNPLKVDMHVDLQKLQVPRFSPYFNEIITVKVTDGNLDLTAELHYAKTDNDSAFLAENIFTQLNSLAVNDKNDRKLLTIPAAAIRDSTWELAGHTITIGEFSSSNGELNLVRQKEGLVILKELLRPREAQELKSTATETETSPPWLLTLRKGTVDHFSIVLLDYVPAEPTTLLFDNINLTAENISTGESSAGSVDFGMRIDKKGNLAIKGPIAVAPLSTSLAVKLADLQIKTLQPYFADKVNLVISDGALSLEGQLKASQDENKKLMTTFQGKAGVVDFASFDPVAGEDFLLWKDLSLTGLAYDTSNFSLRIKEINWQDFYNKIVVFDTGTLNLNAILAESEKPAVEPPSDNIIPAGDVEKSLQVDIGSIKLDNGKLEFLDHSIKPNYTSSFSELSGTITGLSSRTDVMAEVYISSKLDQHAPLLITGQVNPLGDTFFADLTFDFNDIELSPTSPYSGKFIGYTISKGKLSLDLHYLVDGTKITGKNEAFLDHFTLGDTVESPDALNLPISLAIALLKNRKGEITLNVPVKGDLDDPEFSIGGVVFKAIIGLIAKAATSPFALLGAFLPEGEDLQHVDFKPGSVIIESEYTKNLEAIAKALYDRPGLKMDIKGSVNADQDRTALHDMQFEQLLQNEKFKVSARRKETPTSLAEIKIEPEEYNIYLEKAYKAADFEKPKNFIGLNKKLPPEEMEKLLRDHIVITDDDLRLLAIDRANSVKSFLAEAGPVEPERIFIVEPAVAAGVGGASQVEMIIK